MKLSPHFSLAEFCASQTASRLGINNDLPLELFETARHTCEQLEKVRLRLRSNAILISSGYRCLGLNAALGSKNTSQHVKAEAVDFTCPTFGSVNQVIEAIIDSDIEYDQLLSEFVGPDGSGGWCHLSFSQSNKKQVLIIDKTGTRPWRKK